MLEDGGIGFEIELLLGLWVICLEEVCFSGVEFGVFGLEVGDLVLDLINDIGVL